MSSIDEIVNYVIDLDYNDLPYEVIKAAKTSLIVTISAQMAGSSSTTVKKLVSFVKKSGGIQEGSVFFNGYKAPLPDTAWINSAMVRGFDFDETHDAIGHATATIVPGALAFSEYSSLFKDKPISGKELIIAIAMGIDISRRLKLACGVGYDNGWLAEPFVCLATALIGGRLIGLDKDKILNALGIAYWQSSGNLGASAGTGGGMLAIIGQGLSTRAGVLSVLLSDTGFTSFHDIIDGRWGLYRLYANDNYDKELLTGDIGKRFESLNGKIKLYPGCSYTQATINGVMEMVREFGISADRISEVNIRVYPDHYYVLGAGKSRPVNEADALWSFAYSAALAFIKGSVSFEDFSQKALADSRVMDFAQKIHVLINTANANPSDIFFEIKMNDGRVYKKTLDPPVADSNSINTRLQKCNQVCLKPLTPDNLELLTNRINNLEDVDDVLTIINLLNGEAF